MDEAAAVFGIATPEPVSQDFAVLPENVDAVAMFCRMGTQWRTGMNGREGLDLNLLPWLLTLYPTDEPRQLLEDLQVMERVALESNRED
jgi:hypothetical protein